MTTATRHRYQTIELSPEIAHAVSLVGKIVTHRNRQYRVHGVEGNDWYVFLNGDTDTVVIDLNLTPSHWLREPAATLVPSGHRIGEGRTIGDIPITQLKRGVTLCKVVG